MYVIGHRSGFLDDNALNFFKSCWWPFVFLVSVCSTLTKFVFFNEIQNMDARKISTQWAKGSEEKKFKRSHSSKRKNNFYNAPRWPICVLGDLNPINCLISLLMQYFPSSFSWRIPKLTMSSSVTFVVSFFMYIVLIKLSVTCMPQYKVSPLSNHWALCSEFWFNDFVWMQRFCLWKLLWRSGRNTHSHQASTLQPVGKTS